VVFRGDYKGAIAISWRVDLQIAMLTLEPFTALTVTTIATVVAFRVVLLIAEVIIHLAFERALSELLTQCLGKCIEVFLRLELTNHLAG